CLDEGARRLIGDRRRIWPGEPLDDGSDLRADQVAHAPDDLAVEALLVAEILEDQAFVVASDSCDLVHARALEAISREDVFGGGEQRCFRDFSISRALGVFPAVIVSSRLMTFACVHTL